MPSYFSPIHPVDLVSLMVCFEDFYSFIVSNLFLTFKALFH